MKKFIYTFLMLSVTANFSHAKLVKRFLLENFEQNTGKNQIGGYWYVFNDRDEFFAKPDKITGKIWISTAPTFTTITSTGGIMTIDNTEGAQVFSGCDWDGNGMFDHCTKMTPEPDPLEGTIFQAYPSYEGANSKYHARIEWDFTPSEMKFPFVGIGTNLYDIETITDITTDMKAYRDISEYNALAFWIKVSTTVNQISVGVSYKNGPGAHGDTPYTIDINFSSNQKEKWIWKVVRFQDFTLPDWVPTSKYSKQFNEFNFNLESKLTKLDKIKSLNFEVEGGRDWDNPKQNMFVEANGASGWMEIDDIYLVKIDTTNISDFNKDTDNDGYTDFEEYAFGSDINNIKSYPSRDLNSNNTPDQEEQVDFINIKCEPKVADVNSGLKIKYTLTKNYSGSIKIKILNSNGMLVAENNIQSTTASGEYLWECKTKSGKKASAGLYIVIMELSNGNKKVEKFIMK